VLPTNADTTEAADDFGAGIALGDATGSLEDEIPSDVTAAAPSIAVTRGTGKKRSVQRVHGSGAKQLLRLLSQ